MATTYLTSLKDDDYHSREVLVVEEEPAPTAVAAAQCHDSSILERWDRVADQRGELINRVVLKNGNNAMSRRRSHGWNADIMNQQLHDLEDFFDDMEEDAGEEGEDIEEHDSIENSSGGKNQKTAAVLTRTSKDDQSLHDEQRRRKLQQMVASGKNLLNRKSKSFRRLSMFSDASSCYTSSSSSEEEGNEKCNMISRNKQHRRFSGVLERMIFDDQQNDDGNNNNTNNKECPSKSSRNKHKDGAALSKRHHFDCSTKTVPMSNVSSTKDTPVPQDQEALLVAVGEGGHNNKASGSMDADNSSKSSSHGHDSSERNHDAATDDDDTHENVSNSNSNKPRRKIKYERKTSNTSTQSTSSTSPSPSFSSSKPTSTTSRSKDPLRRSCHRSKSPSTSKSSTRSSSKDPLRRSCHRSKSPSTSKSTRHRYKKSTSSISQCTTESRNSLSRSRHRSKSPMNPTFTRARKSKASASSRKALLVKSHSFRASSSGSSLSDTTSHLKEISPEMKTGTRRSTATGTSSSSSRNHRRLVKANSFRLPDRSSIQKSSKRNSNDLADVHHSTISSKPKSKPMRQQSAASDQSTSKKPGAGQGRRRARSSSEENMKKQSDISITPLVTRKGQPETTSKGDTCTDMATSGARPQRRRYRSDVGVRRGRSLDNPHLVQSNSGPKRRSSKEKLWIRSSSKPKGQSRSVSSSRQEEIDEPIMIDGNQSPRRKKQSQSQKHRSRSTEGHALPSTSRLRDSSIGRYRRSQTRYRSGSRSRGEDRPLMVQAPKTRAVLEREKSLSKIFYGDEEAKKSDDEQQQEANPNGTRRAATRVSVRNDTRFFPNASFSALGSFILDDLDVGTDLAPLGFSALSGHSKKSSNTEADCGGQKTPIASGDTFNRRKVAYRNQLRKNKSGNDDGGDDKPKQLSKCFNMALTNMNQLVH